MKRIAAIPSMTLHAGATRLVVRHMNPAAHVLRTQEMSPNRSDWFPTMTALYHVIVLCGTPLGCRYGTLVDLDGKRCERLGVLELSMEVPGADAA